MRIEREGRTIQFNERQQAILSIVRDASPITGDEIADKLKTTRAVLRSDLDFLSQLGILVAKPRIGYIYNESLNGFEVYKELIDLVVKDYQSVPTVLSEQASAYDAMVALFVANVGSLCIVDENNALTGVVSRKDLLKLALNGSNVKDYPVSIIMTRMPNIVMTTPDESLWSAARKLIVHEVDSLPITRKLNQGHEVIGRFTKTNVAKAFVDLGYGDLERKYDVQ